MRVQDSHTIDSTAGRALDLLELAAGRASHGPQPAGERELQRSAGRRTARIAIKVKGRILFINSSDILAAVAQDNYVLLQLERGSYCLREPISTVAEKLEPYGFLRIHRSVLVNRSWVEEIRPDPTGEYVLRVKGGREFTVTRTYKNNLKLLAELWLGNETFVER
jgi:DNA-binding LytR/AlgR family response regulator